MRQLNKNLLRVFYILLLCALLALPMLAAESPKADLRVYPVEDSGTGNSHYGFTVARQLLDAEPQSEATSQPASVTPGSEAATQEPTVSPTQTIVERSAGTEALRLIKSYEGFSEKRMWDYERYSIGYGSAYDKALEMFPEIKPEGVKDDDVTITQTQGEALLQQDLVDTEKFLNNICKKNNILLNQNQFDALVDFTYNVGSGWWTYKNSEDGSWCLLRQMLEDDPATWTQERAEAAFGAWRLAGGEVLEPLVRRRAEEAKLFMTAVKEPEDSDETAVFPDVSRSQWYYDYVTAAYRLKLMQGDEEGTFRPEASLTRAEMVQALANFAKADLTAYEGKASAFTDVAEDAWYAKAVAWAAEQGLVNGMGDGTFAPETPISRQHLCSIMARYLRKQGLEPETAVQAFADDSLMEDTSREDIYFCAGLGLVNGVGDNLFDPQSNATRGETAKILVGMYALTEANTEAA